MGIWAPIKYAINSSLGTEYFRSLDKMISATMILEGASGTKFYITNMTTGDTFSATLASGESKIVVPVPLGTYTINVMFNGKSTTVSNFVVEELGKPYKLAYLIELKRFTSDGVFIVPSRVNRIFVDAAAGGGGGGAGFNSNSGAAGGGAGGSCIINQEFNVTQGASINIAIGIGGNGGKYSNSTSKGEDGRYGNPTIIGNLITLGGGSPGSGSPAATSGGSNQGGSGGGGSNGGASGGSGGYNNGGTNVSAGNKGSEGLKGRGGSAGRIYQYASGAWYPGGGGGGGSYGSGGAGGTNVSSKTNSGPGYSGTYGGGGGGGAVFSDGGNGGNGIVIIYTGVVA